jgi:hypothetical protein
LSNHERLLVRRPFWPTIGRLLEGSWYVVVILFGAAYAAPTDQLREFGSFLGSALLLQDGQNPYAVHPLTHYVPRDDVGPTINRNPPTLFPLFQALAQMEPFTARSVWLAVSCLCYLVMVVMLVRAYRERITPLAVLWLFALVAVWDTLSLGQLYLALAFLGICGWRWLQEGRSILAGLAIGVLAAVKPNFLVVPGLLLIAGYWRTAAAATLFGVAIVGASVLLYGLEPWQQWLALLGTDGPRAGFVTNGSLIGLATRLNAPLVGTITAVGLLAASAIWAWRIRPPAVKLTGVAIMVSLLASPIAWVHYSLLAVPVLISQWKNRGPAGAIAAFLLTVPTHFPVLLRSDDLFVRLSLGSIYVWAFVAMGWVALRAHGCETAPDQASTSNLRTF